MDATLEGRGEPRNLKAGMSWNDLKLVDISDITPLLEITFNFWVLYFIIEMSDEKSIFKSYLRFYLRENARDRQKALKTPGFKMIIIITDNLNK